MDGSDHPRRIVVVGTGTGVGKTELSVVLVRALRDAGAIALGLKPVETGVARTDHEGDAELLGIASQRAATRCYGFAEPLSPHLAARRVGTSVEVSVVVRWIAEQERPADAEVITVVETAGGLCSPLSETANNLTLLLALRPAYRVLVAANRLGVLHDALACVALMQHAGQSPELIVLSRIGPADSSTDTNADELSRLSGIPVVDFDRRDPASLQALTSAVQPWVTPTLR